MPGLNELADDFADGTLNASLWSGSYGDPTEADGQAHIPCSTGYAGLKSGIAYTLSGNTVFVRLNAPDPTGATSAAASVLVLSSTGGTDAGFIVDTAQSAIGLYNRVGYADASAVFLTYSAADHAWLQLRDTAGTLYWETSPDGLNWTVRRTVASPAWLADPDLAFLIEGHRDAGPTTSIDIATVNVLPTVDLTPAAETTQAQPLALRKTVALGTITVLDTPALLNGTKQLALQAAQETHTPLPLGTAKHTVIAAALETNTAQALTPAKHHALAAALEVSTARPLVPLPAEPLDGLTAGTPRTRWATGPAPRTAWTAGTPRT